MMTIETILQDIQMVNIVTKMTRQDQTKKLFQTIINGLKINI